MKPLASIAGPSRLHLPPADREQEFAPGFLRQSLLKLIDELIAFVQDLVLGLEDLLPLAMLLPLQLAQLLLDLVLHSLALVPTGETEENLGSKTKVFWYM